MRVLVTGGAGFIGSHVVEHFQGKAESLDNNPKSHKKTAHYYLLHRTKY